MATTGSNEEIIEKRDTSPLATSCLILSALAILAAIILQFKDIGEARKALDAHAMKVAKLGQATEASNPDIRRIRERVSSLIAKTEVPSSDRAMVEEILRRTGQPGLPPAGGAAPRAEPLEPADPGDDSLGIEIDDAAASLFEDDEDEPADEEDEDAAMDDEEDEEE
jgi:hypothetical protein